MPQAAWNSLMQMQDLQVDAQFNIDYFAMLKSPNWARMPELDLGSSLNSSTLHWSAEMPALENQETS